MKTLILGHGRKYELNDIRCSPHSIPVEQWFHNEYTCVDINPKVEPDIVFDLKKRWTFSQIGEYDLIIDTCGLIFSYTNKYSDTFMGNLYSCLNNDGTFYGQNGVVCNKINGELWENTDNDVWKKFNPTFVYF